MGDINADLNPFQISVDINLPSGTGGQNGGFAVPAGKRLVIEYVSAAVYLPTGQKVSLAVTTSLTGATTGTTHRLVATARGPFGAQDYFEAGQLVRLRADPGTIVSLRADRTVATGAGVAHMSLSGYLVNVA